MVTSQDGSTQVAQREEESPEERWERLKEKASRFPQEPGIYLMYGAEQSLLYVGKARVLRDRIRSYFQEGSSDTRAFVERLEEFLEDIDFVVTRTEKEALLVENDWIKKHKPRFNVLLKDDKNFLLLRINPNETYPWLQVVRQRQDDEALYFGPYPSASAIRQTLRLLHRHFLLRTCTDQVLQNRKRVCLEYQIRRCLGPCVYPIDQALYRSQVESVILFLQGKSAVLIDQLKKQMRDAALAQRYELAANYRDQIRAIEQSLERQRVVLDPSVSCDAIAFYQEGFWKTLQLLRFRDGKLDDARSIPLEDNDLPSTELLRSFVSQFYASTNEIPREILLSEELSDPQEQEDLAAWLSERAGGRVQLITPKRGEKHALIELALKNARASLEERQLEEQHSQSPLARIAKRLGMLKEPTRIECFDISNFQGSFAVGSMVVFVDGKPAKGQYRKFTIKGDFGGKHNDFGMMFEVLARRFRRGSAETGGDGLFAERLPDLLVIDGGRGQLAMAVEVLKQLEIRDVTVVGLAKEKIRERKSGDVEKVIDRIYQPGIKNPIQIRTQASELFLLCRCRDEAHRTAVGFHTSLRQKATLRSQLDDIPGIGEVRRKLLLTHFGSVAGVARANAAEVSAVLKISEEQATQILQRLPRVADTTSHNTEET